MTCKWLGGWLGKRVKMQCQGNSRKKKVFYCTHPVHSRDEGNLSLCVADPKASWGEAQKEEASLIHLCTKCKFLSKG